MQEATVVIRNIFRKYPNQYESIISVLCENMDSLDEPEAKAAMIWVIGEYADRIEDSDVLLDDFLESFLEESHEVQLALLTATVKLFIQRPKKGAELVPKVLKWATEETDNPDLRDRGYMYWRLLSSAPEEAKRVVMGEKPPITAEESEKLDPATLEEMCLNVGTLATVYLKPVNQVFRSARPRKLQESPALQHNELPTVKAQAQLIAKQRAVEERSRIDTSISSTSNGSSNNANGHAQGGFTPTNGVQTGGFTPTSATGNGNGDGNINAAVNDADLYFSSIGRQSTWGASPIHQDAGGGGGSSWVVNQNAGQGMVLSPVAGDGDGHGGPDLLL